ncbi:DUF1707 domain-containing protein [Nakamurella endophytica]|uniref:DUF1707 domain-containing protein n=1 Tax=Nakamurella endophytica TaxID=1748367 RepID=UPI00166BEE7F|nr:DUF1707 domain-containing protein [Nakamurella endophytica]
MGQGGRSGPGWPLAALPWAPGGPGWRAAPPWQRTAPRPSYDTADTLGPPPVGVGIGVADPSVRIGDRERQAAHAVLGRALAEGYLSVAEFDDRSARTWTATTGAEVDRLLDDLPVAELRRSDPSARAAARAAARRESRRHLWSWLALSALMVLIWLVIAIPTGAWYPWPVWPVLGTGIGAVAHTVQDRRAGPNGEALPAVRR